MHTLDHLAGVANRASIHYTGEAQLREVQRLRPMITQTNDQNNSSCMCELEMKAVFQLILKQNQINRITLTKVVKNVTILI